MFKKTHLKIISYLSIIALIISVYLVYLHYTPTTTSFCNISETINCDIVNKSTYAEILGIPVALAGTVTFLMILILAQALQKNKRYTVLNKEITPKTLYNLLIILLTLSLLLSIYLLYIEFFVLYALCLFCVILDILILEMFIIAINAQGGDRNGIKSTKKTK